MIYTAYEAKQFEKEVCMNCKFYDSCKQTFSDMQQHVINCPKMFNWKIGFTSYVAENCKE